MRLSLAVPFAGLALLSGCVGAPAPPPPARPVPIRPPAPVPPPPAAPPLSSDWRDWPVAPGDWRYRSDAGGSSATFGDGGAPPRLTLRCERGANRILLSRAGTAPGTSLTIRTTTTTRTLPAQATAGAITATLGTGDRLLDAIGFSRGRVLVESPPLPPLVIPAWAEILRVVEDCRD